KAILDHESPAWRQMFINLFDERLIRLEGLVVQNVGHERDIIRTAKFIQVKVSTQHRDSRFESGIFDCFLRQRKRRGKIEHRRSKFGIDLAEGNRVGAGSPTQIQEADASLEPQSFG